MGEGLICVGEGVGDGEVAGFWRLRERCGSSVLLLELMFGKYNSSCGCTDK